MSLKLDCQKTVRTSPSVRAASAVLLALSMGLLPSMIVTRKITFTNNELFVGGMVGYSPSFIG